MYVHEGVRKAHFCAVDDSIAHGFDEDEVVMVYGIVDEALDRHLDQTLSTIYLQRTDAIMRFQKWASYLQRLE